MKEQFIAVAAELFPTYPTVNTFYFTADGFAFLGEETATKNAAKLEDKTVTAISRDDVKQVATPVETAPAETEQN